MTFLPAGHAPLKFAPYADLFPMLSDKELDELGDDMAANGQQETVKLFRGAVLDGRNRYTACARKNIGVRTEVFTGTDREALFYVCSKNLLRRHLDWDDRVRIAAKMEKLKFGTNRYTREASPIGEPVLALTPDEPARATDPALSQAERAELMNVSKRSVERADKVFEKGAPAVQAAYEAKEIPVSVAEKIARLPEQEQPAALEKVLPKGNRAIMSSRQEPDDSLDFFPTPPWATRALVEEVLIPMFDALVVRDVPGKRQLEHHTAWEPACGEGHMAEVLREYFGDVLATDVFDYGYGDETLDFLSGLETAGDRGRDFIITNPPFGDKSEGFVLRAIEQARVGVAMFVRLQWLETVGRFERIFRDNPPTRIVFFAERVNLCKGRWEPEGGTATAYIWLVWLKGEQPLPPWWIRPGRREALSHPDDAARFTQHPVMKAVTPRGAVIAETEAAE